MTGSRRARERFSSTSPKGGSSKEIASRLEISVRTAKAHRAQLMEALDIHDIAGLVRYAVRKEWSLRRSGVDPLSPVARKKYTANLRFGPLPGSRGALRSVRSMESFE